MDRRIYCAIVLPWLLLGASTDRVEAQSGLEPRASEILRRSLEFISAAPAFAVAGESGNEELKEDGQLLEFGADDFVLVVRRPSQARLLIESRAGPSATLILDGESMSVHTVFNETFYYDTTEQPGDIDASLDQLAAELGVPRQIRDFPSYGATAALDTLTSGYYVGEAFIDDVKCDYLALRDDTRDVQVWIAQGAEPVPRRIVIRHRLAEGQPRVWAELTEWDFSPDPGDDKFTLTLPPGAERVEFFSSSPKQQAE